jgi:hypothetical protein
VVTSVNGRVVGPTPEMLWLTTPAGGLKLRVGKVCWKAGVSPGLAPKTVWVALLKKKFPTTGPLLMVATGVTSVGRTCVVNELATGP